jgi:hypothetical protein
VSVADGSGAISVTDNLITGATAGAVVAMRSAAAVSGDLALNGASGFPEISLGRNRVDRRAAL